MSNKIVQIFSLLCIGVMTFATISAQTDSKVQTSSEYRLIKKISFGGEGGWDYLFADADAHRLYISHATKVVVIDTEKDLVIGAIPNTNGVQ